MSDLPNSRRFYAYVTAFVMLTAGGLVLAFTTGPAGLSDLLALGRLSPSTTTLAAALCLALFASEALRFWVYARASGVSIGYGACLDVTLVYLFFSWISPAAVLGMPAAAFMMFRYGVAPGDGLAISFLKSLSGLVVLALLSMVFLWSGLGPRPSWGMELAVIYALVVGLGLLAPPALAALFRQRASRSLEGLQRRLTGMAWIRRREGGLTERAVTGLFSTLDEAVRHLGRFRSTGLGGFGGLVASQVIYHLVFAACGMVFCVAMGADDAVRALGSTLLYNTVVYIMPVPGGSGFSEPTAHWFYGDLLPAKQAVVAMVLYRCATFYAQLVAGWIRVSYLGLVKPILSFHAGRNNAPQDEER